MKKYILFLILILVTVGSLFIANAITVNNNLNKKFANSGYVLKYTGDSERYYFSEDTIYKKSYNNQVLFKDTEGDKVVIDQNNFIHYGDGSISSFTKGALINLDEIDSDPITYYNFSANKVLKKLSNKKYIAKNLDKELEFTNLIWKISGAKYLVAGTPIKIIFSDKTEKEIDGYLEIEYSDNEIVKIFNQEVKYETISTDVYIQIGENIKINLGNKYIAKNGINEMSLENMVIDSNDNINIVDLDEYKEEEKGEGENNAGTSSIAQGGTSGATSGGDISANGGTINLGSGTISSGENGSISDGNNSEVETEIEDALSVSAPKYTVTEFYVSATGVTATVEIEDKEARLTTGTTTSILNNATGKIVYSLEETGETQIKVDTASLEPDTEYTLVMTASYAIEKSEYKKNFIYKVFRTSTLGVTLEKNLFTDDSLSFNVKFDSDSTVTKLDVELVENGQVREGIVNTNGSSEKIEFDELTPDTEYTIKIKNVYIGNTSNNNTYTYAFRTLKSIPKLSNGKTHGNVQVEIDKWNSQFVLSIPDLKENVVESLNYKVYTIAEGKETLVYNKVTTDINLKLKIDDAIILRNTDYYCKVDATYYDNEKVVEYEIANTETSFNMNSSEMPSVRFEAGNNGSITFNSIKGTIIIDDEGKTINANTAKVEIIYSSTTKGVSDNGTLSFNGIDTSLEIPIELKELKSNETYKFSVYATYDLHDQNGERYGYIGSVLITTKEPIPMVATWNLEKEGIDISLKLDSTEASDLEAQSLYSFDLSLYLGQEGASKVPYKEVTIVDSGIESFASSLKEQYYDESGKITQSTFGLTDAEMAIIQKENKYCTIVLTNAQDYVSRNKSKSFVNNLPILNASKTYSIQELNIKNPSSSKDAISISQIEKERIEKTSYNALIGTNDYQLISDITSNNNINDSTIVALNVSANMSNSQLEVYEYFKYFIYDENNNKVAESGIIKKDAGGSIAPSALFLISNGTSNEIENEGYLSRGNKYYVKYYAYIELDENGEGKEKYPFDENGVDYWTLNSKPDVTANKQLANIIMYPSTSDEDSLTYKYKVNDIDNAIHSENGNKYFYHFYAGVAEYEGNKKKISEGINNIDNGFWTVKFDKLGNLRKNYDFEVKVLQSKTKNAQPMYENLVTQKFDEIITDFNSTVNLQINTGVSTTITFNDLSAIHKEKIAKIKVEFIDTEGKIPQIDIEKSVEELINDNWKININYLDLIYKTEQSIKNKTFNVNVKIYYINGQVGYDAINEGNNDELGLVTYQAINGDWLKIISSNGEFQKIVNEDGSTVYPVIYKLHRYEFNDERVLIKQAEEEVSWLNYSNKGLTRYIETSVTPIIPKKIESYEASTTENIDLANVIPGIKSLEDLEIVTTPTTASIKLNKLYSKDTLYDKEQVEVLADIYESYENLDDKLKKEGIVVTENGVDVENLTQGQNYYCKLYLKVGNNKYYLYDLDRNTNDTKYTFTTLDEVKIETENQKVDIYFTKDSVKNGQLVIKHGASIKKGYKGFIYEICDNLGRPINEKISYSVDESFELGSTTNGKFEIKLDEFSEKFTVVINADRGTFFEYNTQYTIKITPVITANSELGDNIENTKPIGETVTKKYSYSPIVPEMLLYAKRVKNVDEDSSKIEWSISTSDEDYLITNKTFKYKLFKNGDETAFIEDTITLNNNYNSIALNKENDSAFDIESAYTLKVYYSYYLSNKNDTVQEIVMTKKLTKVENGISVGAIKWSIESNNEIRLKFYDSYELSKVKSIKCSIYDTNGLILKNVPVITNVSIIDQTADKNDPHKSITFDPDYAFETSKSYIISIQFNDESGNVLASFEAESPEIKN